ncbi:uncharacterized protein LOC105836595 [Monomorium pharaonis]|uniref:uncharacterized protein LOC105836595 n=1 Tax=Monomorium pharaonis TaxID=307658 RepID=UPI00063EDE43|nr:uncharacterized protein LOC105836595 [Monomorium pharaonis]
MLNIPEGGILGNDNDSFLFGRPTLNKFAQSPKESSQSEHFFHSDVMSVDTDYTETDTDTENVPINISCNVLSSIQNIQQTPKQIHCINPSMLSIKNKWTYPEDGDSGKKMKQNIKQHTFDNSNIQQQMSKLQEEKMALAKKRL